MQLPGSPADRFLIVQAAFAADGFAVAPLPDPDRGGAPRPYIERSGRIAVAAEHRSARNGATGRPKTAYYLEGDAETMGWFLGYAAEPVIARMTGDFVDRIVFSFFHEEKLGDSPLGKALASLLRGLSYDLVARIKDDIPEEYHAELKAMHQGCHDRTRGSKVALKDLWALNVGIDGILSHLYTGELFAKEGHHPRLLRIPIMCNAFSAPGAGGGRWFGRDFMFPTADIYQDAACMIIHRCDDGRLSFVSQTAPGIIGSMTAVNEAGLAMGVDMSPGSRCDPGRPGLNSLLLIRHCMERGQSAAGAVEVIASSRRGVSWLYPLADATGDCRVVEAGRSLDPGERFRYRGSLPLRYKFRLPSYRYVARLRRRYGLPEPRDGLVVRSANYELPPEYVAAWNERLWKSFDRSPLATLLMLVGDLASLVGDLVHGRFKGLLSRLAKDVVELFRGVPYSPSYFLPGGRIDDDWKDRHCPGPFYFAPQRARRGDLVYVSNHCLSPEMRLAAMTDWNAILAAENLDDIQWRYDELAIELEEALRASPDGLDETRAWDLINFLRPDGKFPRYYDPKGDQDWRRIQVQGSVSLCDLGERSIRSLFGYYGDESVKIRLREYLK